MSSAVDQMVCGIGAGVVSTLCMHPLDLLKVKFQVATAATGPAVVPAGAAGPGGAAAVATPPHPTRQQQPLGVGRQIWTTLRSIAREDGVRGLYRGLSPNIAGNAASWGLYFLFYTMVKQRKTGRDEHSNLSAAQHLASSAEAGVYSTVLTNPLWVVKTRMFTTTRNSPGAYRSVLDGLYKLTVQEGVRGLSKGMLLALVGVSNGAIQFMTYEELKKWRANVRRRKFGSQITEEQARSLSNIEYILSSGSAKFAAICVTYPYQVVRSRIQYRPSNITPYTSIADVIRRTYASDGFRGFYKGLGTNAVRILPGTCVTFVVYEQLSRTMEQRRMRIEGRD